MASFNISIIICVYNGEKRIVPTLEALSKQHIPSKLKCELLIVDNASTDSTTLVAKDYWNSKGNPFPMSVLYEPHPGKANALVKGYNNAKHELMLLCDDDNWLQPEYLKTVYEIFTLHPDIGLLGGYGKALFNPDEKPFWFNRWENIYVCGKHHNKNGFLDKLDFSIWGAGSVVRKSMWDFLYNNGFTFRNSLTGGKAMSEDAELSLAIRFTGNRLFFDERLWFTHDLRGNRISWENLLKQQKLNGKTNAVLSMYQIAYNNPDLSQSTIKILLLKKIFKWGLYLIKSLFKPKNKPRSIYFQYTVKELVLNKKEYEQLAINASEWINKIKNTYPLSNKR